MIVNKRREDSTVLPHTQADEIGGDTGSDPR